MEFQYNNDACSVYSIFWSDGLDIETIEKNYSMYDELQIWYPRNLNDDIYERYKMIMTFIEYHGCWKRPVQSLECSLLYTEDEIWGQMRKNTRYEIRRAINRDNLHTIVIENPSEDDVAQYIMYYNQFADTKKMSHINQLRVEALTEQNMYAITKCLDDEDNILVEHAYFLDKTGKRVMLATSASLFREKEDSERRNLIGRANRMLHYKDLLTFQKLGFEVYDYGGIGAFNDEQKAIAEFKLGFGGTVETYDASFVIHLKKKEIIDEKMASLQLDLKRKIVIYGFGWAGKYVAYKIENCGITDYMVIENHAEFTDERVYYKDEDLKSLDRTRTLLLVTVTKKTYEKTKKTLNDLGYSIGNNVVTLLFEGEEECEL